MRTRIWTSLLVLSLVALATSGNRYAQAQAAGSPNVMKLEQPAPLRAPIDASKPDASSSLKSNSLKMSYAGKTEEWTAATLAALPHTTITLYNEHAKANQTYSGVPLTVLLTRLGVPDKPHGKEFRLYLVAEGSDGYQVVYSVGEVTPDVRDGTTLVADAMDGKPLGDSGPFQLVSSGDKRPARWVRNLVEIRVLPAD